MADLEPITGRYVRMAVEGRAHRERPGAHEERATLDAGHAPLMHAHEPRGRPRLDEKRRRQIAAPADESGIGVHEVGELVQHGGDHTP